MSTFDSTKRLVPDILGEIVKGKIQLPDFQRGWVWDGFSLVPSRQSDRMERLCRH